LTAEGELEGIIGTFTDITKIKRSEDAILDSENKFRSFFDNAPMYCYMISPSGTILDINKEALEMLGYFKDEIIGQPLLTTVYPPSSHALAKTLFLKWKATGQLKNEEITVINRHGMERTVLLSVNSIKDRHGNLIASISIQKDISERKHIEIELQKSMHDLHERVKELNCLHNIATLVEKRERSLEVLLQEIVEVIPTSWQYPDITWVKIIVGQKEYKTKNYADSPWKMTTPLMSAYHVVGSLDVGYLNEMPILDEGPFLRDEHVLLNTLAVRISDIVERYHSTNENIKLQENLQNALAKVLSGFIPICASCKNVRDNNGVWHQIEGYVREHTNAEFSHSICPECERKLYPYL
jgi:PAS domain S-box-containing protein